MQTFGMGVYFDKYVRNRLDIRILINNTILVVLCIMDVKILI